jgi:eukaryotic-like serine/threonine-protein kinase
VSDLAGLSIDRYKIQAELGRGGMAIVYDTRLEREVAIKVIRMENFGKAVSERMLMRFEREAKALGKMMHPNIVPV